MIFLPSDIARYTKYSKQRKNLHNMGYSPMLWRLQYCNINDKERTAAAGAICKSGV